MDLASQAWRRRRPALGSALALLASASAAAALLSATAFAAARASSAPVRPGRAALRQAPASESSAVAHVSGDDAELVADLAGSGRAYALRPNALPLAPPAEESVQYRMKDFSPGFVVDNIMSDAACKKLVALAEQGIWDNRFSSAPDGRKRLGVTTLFVDEAFERMVFERVKPHLPDHMGGRPIGLNRRWAVIKYEPGTYMNTHVDGHVPGTERVGDSLQYKTGTRSYMTALFWLADDVVGGETVFTFPQGGTWLKVPPKMGAGLFFNHGQNAVSNPYHHGGSVESGVKYIVRSDVIYIG